MGYQCANCKNEAWKKTRELEFNHEGLSVSILRPGGKCPNCCREDFLLNFQMYSKYIKHEGKRITEIDWEGFQQTYNKESEANNICELFLNLGIFSLKMDGNWQIVADGSLNLNPTYASVIMCFTDFIHAASYADTKYAKVTYHWHLQRIAKVCTKSDLSEMGLLGRKE